MKCAVCGEYNDSTTSMVCSNRTCEIEYAKRKTYYTQKWKKENPEEW